MALEAYDVYIETESSPEDQKLIVTQFPAMKSQFDKDSEKITLSVKPKSMKLKLEVDLDCNSNSYSREKSEYLARQSKPQSFPSKLVDKSIYTSTRNNIDDDQLFVCKTVNNRLVCRPVSHFLTMRPDLTHFDLKDEIDPREEVKPVSVKFGATERQGGPSKRAQDKSEELEQTEEYQSFDFTDMRSKDATKLNDTLFGKSTKIKPDPDAEMVDKKPLIQQPNLPDIKPKIEKMDIDSIYSNENLNLQSSPKKSNVIRSRVKECLMKAKIVSFEEVYNFIKGYREVPKAHRHEDRVSINTKDILDGLNEYAILVQGNWAIKSEVFYGDSGERESTDVTGIPINLFTAARDYLIWLFNQDRIISRPEFTAKVKIPDHDVLELFNQLSNFRKDIKKWELKLPTDQKFIDNFPEVVQRQATFWKVRKANKFSAFL